MLILALHENAILKLNTQFQYFSLKLYGFVIDIPTFFLAYTPGWNDPPSYSFEDTVSAQQENRPKIFDRIPARVLPNAKGLEQSNLEKSQILLDGDVGSNENVPNSARVLSPSPCDIPVEERLSYVLMSLNDSIQKSTLPEVNG